MSVIIALLIIILLLQWFMVPFIFFLFNVLMEERVFTTKKQIAIHLIPYYMPVKGCIWGIKYIGKQINNAWSLLK